METRTDAAGNLVGHLPGCDLDAGTLCSAPTSTRCATPARSTARSASLVAIACVERLRAEEVTLPFAVDVYGFADEEGLRYGTAYLGSRAVAGTFDPRAVRAHRRRRHPPARRAHRVRRRSRRDRGGAARTRSATSRRTWSRARCWSARPPRRGRDRDRRPDRAQVTFTGEAGHAGTVPMVARRDAACALAEFVLAVEEAGRAEPGLVATVGRLTALPGAPNAIPGQATARSTSATRRRRPRCRRGPLLDRATAIGAARGVAVAWEPRMDAPAVAMDPAASSPRWPRRPGGPRACPAARATTRSRWRRPCPSACSSSGAPAA